FAAVVAALMLAACSTNSVPPAAVSITSPASRAPVSGTAAIQVPSADDSTVSRVEVFARSRGATESGVLVGSSTRTPHVVSWYTPSQPNLAELELVAVAVGHGGAEVKSNPVPVRVHNSGVPNLELLTAYTIVPEG